MALPTQDQLAAVTAKAAAVTQPELAALGINIGADQIAQILQMGVDALCMRAWRDVAAAGKAAETTTTLEQAEADEGSTPS